MSLADPRLIAVVGAKGGCGATTLTVHLGAELASTRGVCVIDLDFGRGDLAGLLNLEAPSSIPTLLAGPLDAARLRGSAAHHVSGLVALVQPTSLRDAVHPSKGDVTRLLQVARETWDLVLVDCGDRVDEPMIEALNLADRVILVMTPDVLAVRDVVRLRDLRQGLGIPEEKEWIVLNKLSRHPALSLEDVEDLLRVRASATLAEDTPAINLAVIQGKALRDVAAGSNLGREFATLWARLTGEAAPLRRRTSWLGGWT